MEGVTSSLSCSSGIVEIDGNRPSLDDNSASRSDPGESDLASLWFTAALCFFLGLETSAGVSSTSKSSSNAWVSRRRFPFWTISFTGISFPLEALNLDGPVMVEATDRVLLLDGPRLLGVLINLVPSVSRDF